MKRRAFLAATIGAVAGCTGRPVSSGATSTTTTRSSGSENAATGTSHSTGRPANGSRPRRQSLNGSHTLSVTSTSQNNLGALGVRANARLVQDTVTKDQPPRIDLTISTSSTQPIHVVHRGDAHHDAHLAIMDKTRNLVLSKQQPTQKRWNHGCWTADWNHYMSSTEQYAAPGSGTTITANSPYARTYWIYNPSSDPSTCYAPGEYRVTDSIKVGDTVTTWAFRLDVER